MPSVVDLYYFCYKARVEAIISIFKHNDSVIASGPNTPILCCFAKKAHNQLSDSCFTYVQKDAFC